MLERVLQELKHDRDDRGEPPIPEDEGLAPVAEEVGEDEDVHLVGQVVEGVGRTLVVVDAAVTPVV